MIKLKPLIKPLLTQLDESIRNGSGWFIHEGQQTISVIFEDGSDISFTLECRNKFGDVKDKIRTQAASKWSSIAKKLYKNPELNEVGDPIQKSWKECFNEALTHEEVQPYIKNRAGDTVFDPVNFTPRK